MIAAMIAPAAFLAGLAVAVGSATASPAPDTHLAASRRCTAFANGLRATACRRTPPARPQ